MAPRGCPTVLMCPLSRLLYYAFSRTYTTCWAFPTYDTAEKSKASQSVSSISVPSSTPVFLRRRAHLDADTDRNFSSVDAQHLLPIERNRICMQSLGWRPRSANYTPYTENVPIFLCSSVHGDVTKPTSHTRGSPLRDLLSTRKYLKQFRCTLHTMI